MKTIKEKEVEIKTFLDTVYVDHFAVDTKSVEFTIKDNVIDWEDVQKLVGFAKNNGLELSMEKQEETDQDGITESWIMFEYKLPNYHENEVKKFIESIGGKDIRFCLSGTVVGWLFDIPYSYADDNFKALEHEAKRYDYSYEPPKGKRVGEFGTASFYKYTL